jgi:hypothetical protein
LEERKEGKGRGQFGEHAFQTNSISCAHHHHSDLVVVKQLLRVKLTLTNCRTRFRAKDKLKHIKTELESKQDRFDCNNIGCFFFVYRENQHTHEQTAISL